MYIIGLVGGLSEGGVCVCVCVCVCVKHIVSIQYSGWPPSLEAEGSTQMVY
jgi:hypothetical protein